jgi:hypothetical protein
MSPVRFEFAGLPAKTPDDVQLFGRRKDLAGAHETQPIHLQNGLATLPVGPWEFAVTPVDGYYVSGFSGLSFSTALKTKRFDGWNETAINNWGGRITFRFSSGPGALHGRVTDNSDPVVGAPVFLEPVDLEPARRITDTYVTITDTHGLYRFGSLAPGQYRVLSSFEYQMPDSKTMVEARAKELQIDAHSDLAQDLDLYVIR